MALDLLQLYSIFLFRLVTVITNQWQFGAGFCVATGSIDLFVKVARSFLMCVFVIDLFLSVFAAYFYPRHAKKIAITLSVISWILALLFPLPALPGLLNCYGFLADQLQCAYIPRCSQPCGVYARCQILLIFVPTTIVPVVLYILLYWKVKKIKQVRVVPVGAGENNQAAKQDWKAAITFFLLFLTAFILTSPPTVLLIILAAVNSTVPSQVEFVLLAILTSVPSLLVVADPIVIMRHSDVKEVLCEIKTKLCGRCGTQQDERDRNPATSSGVTETQE